MISIENNIDLGELLAYLPIIIIIIIILLTYYISQRLYNTLQKPVD